MKTFPTKNVFTIIIMKNGGNSEIRDWKLETGNCMDVAKFVHIQIA